MDISPSLQKDRAGKAEFPLQHKLPNPLLSAKAFATANKFVTHLGAHDRSGVPRGNGSSMFLNADDLKLHGQQFRQIVKAQAPLFEERIAIERRAVSELCLLDLQASHFPSKLHSPDWGTGRKFRAHHAF